jgi:hypothetical protein
MRKMALKFKHKAGIAAAVLVLALIAYGAVQGRTKQSKPSETFGKGGSALSANEAAKGGKGSSGNMTDDGLRIIKTYTRRDCTLAPWPITDKLGYFEEEGVKLVFTGELQPPQRAPSVLNGDNDTADLHPNALAVAIAGGAPLKGVA